MMSRTSHLFGTRSEPNLDHSQLSASTRARLLQLHFVQARSQSLAPTRSAPPLARRLTVTMLVGWGAIGLASLAALQLLG